MRSRGSGYEVLGVRELTAEDVKGLKRAKLPAFKRLRAIHRRIALLLASGLKQTQVAELTGYSDNRVSMLCQDPAFQNLVSTMQGQIEAQTVDALSEFNTNIARSGMMAEQIIYSRLERAVDEGTEDEIPWAALLRASRDAADRVGLAKRSISVNVGQDFASRLDKAVQRSRMKVIETSAVASAAPALVPEQGSPLTLVEGSPAAPRSPAPVLVHDAAVVKPAAGAPEPPSAQPRPLVTRRA